MEIDPPYMWELFQKQNGKCRLSGRQIGFDQKVHRNTTASLDRIDSSIGYIAGNVQWVHKDINKMKMEFENDYFIEMCREVAAYHEDGVLDCDPDWGTEID